MEGRTSAVPVTSPLTAGEVRPRLCALSGSGAASALAARPASLGFGQPPAQGRSQRIDGWNCSDIFSWELHVLGPPAG